MKVISTILELFAESSGLRINLQKCSITCIRCDEETSQAVADHFQCIRKDFPITYLGLPLSIGRLRKADIWPLVDKFSNKLKGWKPKLLSTGGRLTLTRSVLMALLLHLLSVLQLPQWALAIINRRCRAFVWQGEDEINGGHCLLPWSKVCRPLEVRGLGILNLQFFGTALQCRWRWLRWAPQPRPWSLTQIGDDQDAIFLCNAAMFIKLGDGFRAKFWSDNWLPGGRAVQDWAPSLFSFV